MFCFVQEPRVGDLLGNGGLWQLDRVEIPVELLSRGILRRPPLDMQLSTLSFITLRNLDFLAGFF